MEIVGEKVVLRAAEVQDQEMLRNLIEDPDITKITRGYQRPAALFRQMSCFRIPQGSKGNLCRIVADKQCPQTGLGVITLTHTDPDRKCAEIQIKLRKSVRGKGYGQDAVHALVLFAFEELRLDCMESNILENNTASRKLFEKCGFIQIRIQKGRADRDGHCRNICSYRIKRQLVKEAAKRDEDSLAAGETEREESVRKVF